ncbi:MAG: amidohydrolase family protein [Virgibacillus sp.]|nr:amidohydrolase family protein [Virgibacillus sp.]
MRYYLEADTIIMNARVFTMDDLQPRAEAIAIKDGNIVYVGSEEEAFSWKGENTQIVDVNGKTVLPGFIESHTHPVEYGLNLLKLDCRPNETPSIGAILKKVKEKEDRLPEGEWIRGWGGKDSRMKEQRNRKRWDLEKVAPNNPVML